MPRFTVTIAAESPEQAARLAITRTYGRLAFPVRTTGASGSAGYFRPYRHLTRGRKTSCGAAMFVSAERSS